MIEEMFPKNTKKTVGKGYCCLYISSISIVQCKKFLFLGFKVY